MRGDRRGSFYAYDQPPAERGVPGAGTVHHVAWASTMEDHEGWHERVSRSGAQPTPIIDRFYFRSIYFREPSGVLFEIATIGPGFATDEPPTTSASLSPCRPPSSTCGTAWSRCSRRSRTPGQRKSLPTPPVSTAVDSLAYRLRPAQGEPAGALVLLHGRGADEHDLTPLLEALDPERRLVGVLPRGPVSLPPGGAHWYAVRQIGYPDPQTFQATYRRASNWLDALPDLAGVPIGRTVIGGFSQGAVMSHALGLGEGRPAPAGILALSGFIPTVESFALDLEKARGLPVAIGHGTGDPIIGVEWGRQARERLEAAGADVIYRESPMGHSIDPAFVDELARWLARIL